MGTFFARIVPVSIIQDKPVIIVVSGRRWSAFQIAPDGSEIGLFRAGPKTPNLQNRVPLRGIPTISMLSKVSILVLLHLIRGVWGYPTYLKCDTVRKTKIFDRLSLPDKPLLAAHHGGQRNHGYEGGLINCCAGAAEGHKMRCQNFYR